RAYRKPGAQVPSMLLSVSWYRLLAKDFEGTVKAVDEAIAIDPNYIPAYTNKAHALMFLGKWDAAKTIYAKFRGEKVPQMDASWEQLILNDLAEFEKNGLSDPKIAEVKAMMASS